jgi:hypothetical protein
MINTIAVIGWATFIGCALLLLGVMTLTTYHRITAIIAFVLLGLMIMGFLVGIVFGILAADYA